MVSSEFQIETTDLLQNTLDEILKWTRRWNIKFNKTKSIHAIFTYRRKDLHYQLYVSDIRVPQSEKAKYLGLHLDSTLNWKHHVKQKSLQIVKKLCQMYWVIGCYSKTTFESKLQIYL